VSRVCGFARSVSSRRCRSARRASQGAIRIASSGDDCHQRRQQRPARLEHELVADVLDGVEADQRQQERECDDAGDRGLAQRASDIDARGGR